MIGHLHLLWWWALEIAPDGDLSPFDREDLADAAGWTGDADVLITALIDCGPGDSFGFLDLEDGALSLHDWQEYGGRYGKRVQAAKTAAAARWKGKEEPASDANALRTHEVTHDEGTAEERRGEESREEKKKAKTRMRVDWSPDPSNLDRLRERFPKVVIDQEVEAFRDYWLSKGETRADWNASLRTWITNAEKWRQERQGEKPGGWR